MQVATRYIEHVCRKPSTIVFSLILNICILILIIRRDKARSAEQSDYLQLDAAFLCRKLHRLISAADENAGMYIYFEIIYIHNKLYICVCAGKKKVSMQDNFK
jgi:hypothetical protein